MKFSWPFLSFIIRIEEEGVELVFEHQMLPIDLPYGSPSIHQRVSARWRFRKVIAKSELCVFWPYWNPECGKEVLR
jgi:hypothetical protein